MFEFSLAEINIEGNARLSNLYLSSLPSIIPLKSKFLHPSTKSNSAKNIVDYFLEIGLREKDIFRGTELFRRQPINYKFINDPESWLNILELYTIITNCQYYSPLEHGIDRWFDIASNVYNHEAHQAWKLMTKLMPMSLMFNKVASLIRNYNTYQQLFILNADDKNEIIYKLLFDEEINNISPGVATHYTAGVLSQIPRAHGLKTANIEILFNQMKLANIVQILYRKYDLRFEIKNDIIYINGDFVGKYTPINIEATNKSEVLELSNKTNHGFLITKNYWHNNLLLLQKGDVYDAPFSKFKLNWQSNHKTPKNITRIYAKFKNVSDLITCHANQINETKQKYFEAEVSRLHAEMAEKEAIKAKTRLKQYADSLQSIVETRTVELKRKNEFMKLFSSSISHALKTPLTSLRGSVEIFQEYKGSIDSSNSNIFLTNMENDLRRLEQLVKRLLDLSKADMSDEQNGSCFIVAALDKISKSYEKQGLTITINDSGTATLPMPESVFFSIMTNLFDNSLHHAGTGSHIDISISVIHRESTIKIFLDYMDDGPGVSYGDFNNIFNPLFTTSKNKLKTGLGLSIVRQLVQNYQGSIECIPCKDGAHFRLIFKGIRPSGR